MIYTLLLLLFYCYSVFSLTRDRIDTKYGGVLYRKNVLAPDDFRQLQQMTHAARKRLQPENNSIAHKRKGALLQEAVPSLTALTTLVQQITNSNYELDTFHYPPELRTYEQPGAHMAWHVDDILFQTPQIECVLTIDNTSNVQTCWKDQALETEANSVLVLRAGAVEHCVTHLKYGSRTILKCVYYDAS